MKILFRKLVTKSQKIKEKKSYFKIGSYIMESLIFLCKIRTLSYFRILTAGFIFVDNISFYVIAGRVLTICS